MSGRPLFIRPAGCGRRPLNPIPKSESHAMEIMIRRDGRVHGPYPVERIREMLDAGSVVLQDEAWSESEGRWTTLRGIPGLSPSIPNDGGDPDRATPGSLSGLPPPEDTGPAESRRDRAAAVLSKVGFIAIALGTLNAALHMKGCGKRAALRDSPAASADHKSIAGVELPRPRDGAGARGRAARIAEITHQTSA